MGLKITRGYILFQFLFSVQGGIFEQFNEGGLLGVLNPTLKPVLKPILSLPLFLSKPSDLDTIKKNINYAASALCPPNVLTNWSCQSCLRAESSNNMKNISIIGKPNLEYGFVGLNEKDKAIYVGFRGTTTNLDKIVDFSGLQIPHPDVSDKKARVHSGFFLSNLALSNDYIPAIKALLSKKEYSNYSVIPIGHSLGGALATFAAIQIKYRLELDWSRIKLFTYGSPRVGNIEFAKWFNAQPLTVSRVVAYNDIVPHVPSKGFDLWWHIQPEIWIDSTKNPIICDRNLLEDPNCSDSIPLLKGSIDQHLSYFNVSLSGAATTNC